MKTQRRLTNGICSGGDKRRLRATFFARSVAFGSFPRKKLRHIGFAPVGLTQRHIPRTLCEILAGDLFE